jgi:hypothetical protein
MQIEKKIHRRGVSAKEQSSRSFEDGRPESFLSYQDEEKIQKKKNLLPLTLARLTFF